jgi:hypothetical protein
LKTTERSVTAEAVPELEKVKTRRREDLEDVRT